MCGHSGVLATARTEEAVAVGGVALGVSDVEGGEGVADAVGGGGGVAARARRRQTQRDHLDARGVGADAEEGERLDDAPQPPRVARPRQDDHPLRAREEDGEALQTLVDVRLVDARLRKRWRWGEGVAVEMAR